MRGLKLAARKTGCSVEEYQQNRALGFKWCFRCSQWLTTALFGKDATRYDGLAAMCLLCRKGLYTDKYVPTPRVSRRGMRFVPSRDGDKKQARARVNHLIVLGMMPNPNAMPCAHCNHIGQDRRHEYHHHRGYAAAHHEDVIALCPACHRRADRQHWRNRQRNKKGQFYGEAN